MMTSSSAEQWPWLVLRERFPTEAGSDYLVKVNTIQSSQGPVQVLLDFYDGSGEFIERRLTSEWIDSGDDWIEISGLFKAPERAATAQLILQLRIRLDDEMPRPDQLDVWIDDVSVRKAVE